MAFGRGEVLERERETSVLGRGFCRERNGDRSVAETNIDRYGRNKANKELSVCRRKSMQINIRKILILKKNQIKSFRIFATKLLKSVGLRIMRLVFFCVFKN